MSMVDKVYRYQRLPRGQGRAQLTWRPVSASACTGTMRVRPAGEPYSDLYLEYFYIGITRIFIPRVDYNPICTTELSRSPCTTDTCQSEPHSGPVSTP